MLEQRFGSLVVEAFSERKNGHVFWQCMCDCGNIGVFTQNNLKRGNTTSCGCSRIKLKNQLKNQYKSEYRIWQGMHSRCYRENDSKYLMYGQRGIKICSRWNKFDGGSFANFIEDMGHRPDGMSIDRVDNDSDYRPDNCVWQTSTIQSYNQSLRLDNTSGVTGVVYCERLGKYNAQIQKEGKRVNLGWFSSIDEATKVRKLAEVEYYGFNKPDHTYLESP